MRVCVCGGGGGACACVLVRAHVLVCLGLWRGARNKLILLSEALGVNFKKDGQWQSENRPSLFEASLKRCLVLLNFSDEQVRDVTEAPPQERTKGKARKGGTPWHEAGRGAGPWPRAPRPTRPRARQEAGRGAGTWHEAGWRAAPWPARGGGGRG